MKKLLLTNKCNDGKDEYIYPENFENIPYVKNILDIENVQKYVYEKIKKHSHSNIDVYVNAGRAKELLVLIQVCAVLDIDLNLYHYDKDIKGYVCQNVEWKSGKHKEGKTIVKIALFKGRHWDEEIPSVFENKLSKQQIFDFQWQKRRALSILKKYYNKVVYLYISGIKPAYISVLNAAYELGIEIVILHYDSLSGEYFQHKMEEVYV